MIPKEKVDQVLEAARIEEVVGDFVVLRRRGSNLLGLCPFHNEKTPSFTVSPAKGIYKCFGCGKSGNSAGFIMDHEHFSFPEAVRYLARKYNIEIQEEELSPEKLQEQNEKEALFHVTEFAQKYFAQQLLESEKGRAIGLSYFQERGLTEASIRKFGLGYSPDEWQAFTDHALKNGYSLDILIKSGLTIQKEDKHYDRFRGRVIFPIHSVSGRVLGFTARILSSEKQAAKYVNSPESEIYTKSKTLYGISLAKSAIVKNDLSYLVEGNLDVVSLHQVGFENTVASSGTSLTEDQIKLLKRYSKNVTILYDGDAAGIKAAFRATDMLIAEGLHIRIVLFPDGDDPDSYLQKHGSVEFKDFIDKHSDNFILFKTKLLAKETQDDPIKKAALIKELIETISLIPESLDRSVYVKECSSILKMEEQTLISELNKAFRKKLVKTSGPEEKDSLPETTEPAATQLLPETKSKEEDQERKIVELLLNYGNKMTRQEALNEQGQLVKEEFYVEAFLVGEIMNDELTFENDLYQSIFDEYKTLLLQGQILQEQHFINHERTDFRQLAASLLVKTYSVSENWSKKFQIHVPAPDSQEKLDIDVRDSLLSFKMKKLDKRILHLTEQIETAAEEEALILLSELLPLKQIRAKIAKELNRVIS